MFNVNQDAKNLDIYIKAKSDDGRIEFEMSGNEMTVSGEEALRLSSMSSRQKASYKKGKNILPEDVKVFSGVIEYQNGKKPVEKNIRFTSLDTAVAGAPMKKQVQYMPSFGHLRFDLLQNIVDDPEYKKLAISILKQFDDSIVDICYTKADDGTYLESIITDRGVIMPFSAYGDGIKKILYILNKLFEAPDSILLIDEIETGLHKKYYDQLFPVVFALAKKLNVQLFIATHSMEAIDAILKYGDYENEKIIDDPIRVVTLKKIKSENEKDSNVVARNISGKYVYDNRKAFEFEVRL
jgi:hypothetical protein